MCRCVLKRGKCVNDPNNFCYCCGKFTPHSQRRSLTLTVKKAYYLYFGYKVGHEDKEWAPHVCCITCYSGLIQWMNKRRTKVPFAVPLVWLESTNHHSDCYFCMTNIT